MEKGMDVDYLIIGSGVAGLYAAYLLADHGRVLVVTKEKITDGSTFLAQGGVASVLDEGDSFESHIQDTLDAGAGLCDLDAVRLLVTEGPQHVRRLVELGAHFDRDEAGNLKLAKEGGHSRSRIVHRGDLTGREIEEVLVRAVLDRGVPILEYHSAVELITRYHLQSGEPDAGPEKCYGAYIYNRNTWEISIVRAKATILATGGAGQVYLHNTNSSVSSGDGVALAYRAGAEIVNMEFYQFHPTALYEPDTEHAFLISEAVRGHGGILRSMDGVPFMEKYDPRKDLAPRDIVARAIDAEMKRTGSNHVWLDITHKTNEDLMGRFPTIYAHCLKLGIDISKDWIPVVPAAHYMCGGVDTDLNGATCVEGLFASGEVAHTGIHGGNRLASNSILEGLVFSARVASFLTGGTYDAGPMPGIREWDKEGLHNVEEWILVQHNFDALKRVMHNYVGIVRSDLRLHRAVPRIELLYDEVEDFYKRTYIQNKILELRNLTCVARLIVFSALARRESRGLHFNLDFPEVRTPSHEYTVLKRGRDEKGRERPVLQKRSLPATGS